ncbi:MAG: helix-turn-helix domain-containing protein [Candidatus Competibacteraceae bacterium]
MQSNLPPTVKFVLFALSVGWMDADGGSCFPTLAQIAEKAGLSRQAVARALDQAVAAGYLKRWHWGHGKGNRRWNYHIAAPRGEKVTLDNNHPTVIVIEIDILPTLKDGDSDFTIRVFCFDEVAHGSTELGFRNSPGGGFTVFRTQPHTPTGLTPLHRLHIPPVRR